MDVTPPITGAAQREATRGSKRGAYAYYFAGKL